jgi:hypothetical protein
MSSKASATVLFIREQLCFELPVLLQHSSSLGLPLVAFILARHFPVRILLILIEPPESRIR